MALVLSRRNVILKIFRVMKFERRWVWSLRRRWRIIWICSHLFNLIIKISLKMKVYINFCFSTIDLTLVEFNIRQIFLRYINAWNRFKKFTEKLLDFERSFVSRIKRRRVTQWVKKQQPSSSQWICISRGHRISCVSHWTRGTVKTRDWLENCGKINCSSYEFIYYPRRVINRSCHRTVPFSRSAASLCHIVAKI